MKGSDIMNAKRDWWANFLALTGAFSFIFLHLELESSLHAGSEGASLAIIEFSLEKQCCENETFDSYSSSAAADFPYHIWALRLIYTSLIYICHQAL